MNRTLPAVLSLIACSALAPYPGAQGKVHVVDSAGGPGSAYTAISDAIAAAQDGDLVLVRQGQFGGAYSELVQIDGKGIALQAEEGVTVGVKGLRVENVGPSQAVAVRGIGWFTNLSLLLRLKDDLGPVWIEQASGAFRGHMVIEGCRDVVLRQVVVPNPDDSLFGSLSRPALSLTGSDAVLYGCDLTGQWSGCQPGGPPDGSPALSASGSRATLFGSLLTGGDGCSGGFSGDDYSAGGPGLFADASFVDALELRAVGGEDGLTGDPAPAVVTTPSGRVRLRPGSAPRVSTPSPLRAGDVSTMSFVGAPGERVVLLVSDRPAPLQRSRGAFGPLALPAGAARHDVGTVPASGTLTVSFRAPAVGGEFSSFYLQALFVQPATLGRAFGPERLTFATATVLHVLDPSF